MSDRFGFRLMAMALVIWETAVACEVLAQISPRPPFVEDEIGGIHIGADRSDHVVRRYGPGIQVPGIPTTRVVERLCYWDENQQVGLEFRTTELDDVVAMVTVTTLRDQMPRLCRSRVIKINMPVTTGKMIGPGDSLERVLSVYGEPRGRMEEEHAGKKLVLLECEAQHERRPGLKQWYWAGLSFLDGKLASFTIIESEESFSKIMRGR